jgi:hypothetical protein
MPLPNNVPSSDYSSLSIEDEQKTNSNQPTKYGKVPPKQVTPGSPRPQSTALSPSQSEYGR